MLSENHLPNSMFQRRTIRGFVTHLMAAALAPALLASSPPWRSTSFSDTGITASLATIDSSGEIVVATSVVCSAATLALGDSSVQSSCVTKIAPSGYPVFSVQIGGANVFAMVPDGAGNIIVAGIAGPTGSGFVTTPGAYETKPSGPVLCALSSSDGHPLFCTFVDVDIEGLAVDSSGNIYIAGFGLGTENLYVEKVNATGTGAAYLTNLSISPSSSTIGLAADTTGDLYCLCGGFYELNPAGDVAASITLAGEQQIALALDPSGNPEALLRDSANPSRVRLRKYSAGLSMLQFDTVFQVGSGSLNLAVDALGIADIIGETASTNLTEVNPTQQCVTAAGMSPSNAFLVRIDSNGNLLQSTYLQESLGGNGVSVVQAPAITVGASAASVLLLSPLSDVLAMELGPSSATIALGCGGSAASFNTMALAPNEIASFFGAGIGPATPISTTPDPDGIYPIETGGVQITFDGVPAPLLYASSGQVNLVTPGSLSGKSTTQVCAVLKGSIGNCFSAAVQSAAPAIFSSGTTPWFESSVPYAAVLNQDGTVNSQQNPAAYGSVVSLFVTGLGPVTPSVQDGGVTPVPIPTPDFRILVDVCEYLYIDSCAFPAFGTPLYAGPAPFEVEGLGQINVRVPSAPAQILFSLEVVSVDGATVSSDSATIWTE